MNEDNESWLYAAARTGTLDEVRAAFEACSDDERKGYGYWTLCQAAQNIGPYALEIVEFLMEHHDRSRCPIDIDSDTLRDAVENRGPCAPKIVEFLIERGVEPDSDVLCIAAENSDPCALDIVKLLIERGVDRHERDYHKSTAFLEALDYGNTDICDYLLSRDDFCLSDLMPRQQIVGYAAFDPHIETCVEYKGDCNTYITYRGKAISRVSELIDLKGLSYARTVAADIEKILKNEELEPPEEEDIEALQPLIKKIASIDWVSDAQVSCDDFMGCMG